MTSKSDSTATAPNGPQPQTPPKPCSSTGTDSPLPQPIGAEMASQASTATNGTKNSTTRCLRCRSQDDGNLCNRCIHRLNRKKQWHTRNDAEKILWAGESGVGERFCWHDRVPSLNDDGLAERIAAHPIPSGGLYIVGPTGGHKTHLMAARVMNALARGWRAKMVSWAYFCMEVRDTYRAGSEGSEATVLAGYAECDYLGIDDLGVGVAGGGAETSGALRLAYLLLDSRYMSARTTDITTNWMIDEMAESFSEPIARRIADMTTVYPMRLQG